VVEVAVAARHCIDRSGVADTEAGEVRSAAVGSDPEVEQHTAGSVAGGDGDERGETVLSGWDVDHVAFAHDPGVDGLSGGATTTQDPMGGPSSSKKTSMVLSHTVNTDTASTGTKPA
jgi:hypothetical protein